MCESIDRVRDRLFQLIKPGSGSRPAFFIAFVTFSLSFAHRADVSPDTVNLTYPSVALFSRECSLSKMPHPLIPQIIKAATPVAQRLGFDVVDAAFHTNQSPPVLRIDIQHAERDITLDDCEAMSRALDAALDESSIIPDSYVLEISSSGIDRVLSTDRDFISFKGFSVTVITHEPFRGQMSLTGQLIKRDDESVQLNCKGRAVSIPRHMVNRVQFADPS